MTSDYWTARNFRYCHRFPIEIRDADDHAEAIDYYLCQDPSKLAQLLEGKEVIVHTFILQGKNRSAIKDKIETLIKQKKIIGIYTSVPSEEPLKIRFKIKAFDDNKRIKNKIYERRSYKHPLAKFTLTVKL